MGAIYNADNLEVLGGLPGGSVQLVYADPPFGANKDRAGRSGAYADRWESGSAYIEWLRPRIVQLHRVLASSGSIFLHLDRRSVHYARLLLDEVFGEGHFQNEIIWHYTGGGRADRWFPHKHDNILVYNRTSRYKFNTDAVRESYAPTSGYARAGIVSRAGKRYLPNPLGKVMDDVWSIPIVNPMSAERTPYPTQKPEKLLERIIAVATDPGDLVLDPFCGSGTSLVVAERMGREWVGIDCNPHAIATSLERLRKAGVRVEVEDTSACFNGPAPAEVRGKQ